MGPITKAAYLDVCQDCGKHTAIVFANGERSKDLFTKKHVRAMLDVFLGTDEISEEEYLILVEQNEASSLPTSSPLLSKLVLMEDETEETTQGHSPLRPDATNAPRRLVS